MRNLSVFIACLLVIVSAKGQDYLWSPDSLSASYIIDELPGFPLEQKYRLGWHAYLTYMPSTTNEVGFLIHTYTGRDYLNIRYDDIVFIAEAGLYMRINKK